MKVNVISPNLLRVFFLTFMMSLIARQNLSFAQCTTNCTPLNETFGSVASANCPDTQGDAAVSGVVNLSFKAYSPGNPTNDSEPADGEYGVRCNGAEPNYGWFGGGGTTMTDNTTDAAGQTGKYLLINGGPSNSIGRTSEFYHKTISNLCANTTYRVSFYLGNLDRDCGYGGDVSIAAYKFAGGTPVQNCTSSSCPSNFNTTGGTLLGNTGNVDCSLSATGSTCSNGGPCTGVGFQWNHYTYDYTTGGSENSFDLILVDLMGKLSGNDFAMDDITVTWVSGGGVTGCTTPIELISFTAEKAPQNVVLRWSSASEMNFSHFFIEKSTDAVNFEQIGMIKGEGNSSSQHDYTFTDNSANQGIVYYRLKQVDIDGSFKYSVIKSVKIDTNSPVLIYSFDGDLTIQFTAKGEAMYTIVDMLGKTLYTGNRTSEESLITVNKSNFKSGVYIVKVQMGNEVITEKLVLN
jgi:hypothetical protein